MQLRGDKEELIEKRIFNDRKTFTQDQYNFVDYTYQNEIIDLNDLAKQIYDKYLEHIETLKMLIFN